jgi:NTP pyrophosphatase (non-canonical NTP hydrolase)
MVKNDDISKTKSLIERAYGCACSHGFHEDALSVEHYLMLVISEIGEAVEADRKGLSRCDLGICDDALRTKDFLSTFRDYVKDSLPDELADVCIRLYDMCGALGIEPRVEYEDMGTDFEDIFGEDTFCERMYYLSRLLCMTSGVVDDDGTDDCLPQVIGQALSFLFALAKDMKIDLMQHIELKMRYNEKRPYKNGKKY